jgi:multimeric flavodoxin WrbA/putative sterol carrier protein
MNILLLRAYPRKNGYTHRLTDLFVKGVLEGCASQSTPSGASKGRPTGGGAGLVDRDIAAADIKPCIGCYRCWITSPGRCIFKDDMVTLQEDLLHADIIVCATPLNSFSVSSSLKAFLDRTLPLTMPVFDQSPLGSVRNRLRFPDKWPKKIATIVVGAFNGPAIFSGIKSMMSHYANALSMEKCGELLRPESFLLPFTLAKPMTVKTIEAAFVRAGYEIAVNGRISEDTEQKAATPLSSDVPYFKKYSNIYWEHAVALGEKSWDLDLLCRTVTSDVRILMQEMARSIDPKATAKLKAALQFEFPDKDLRFTFKVDRGSCTFLESSCEDAQGSEAADLKVTCSSEVWAKVFMRQINVRDALVNKQIVLSGDKFLFSRLDRYFPPPIM